MADKRDSLLAAVKTALQAATTGNGYNTDVGDRVSFPMAGGNDLNDLPAAIVSVDGENKDEASSDTVEGRLRVIVDAFPDQVLDTTEITAGVFDIVEDIEKVVMLQRELDPPFGVVGAHDAILGGWDIYPLESRAMIGIEYRFTIVYRHDRDDPATYHGA